MVTLIQQAHHRIVTILADDKINDWFRFRSIQLYPIYIQSKYSNCSLMTIENPKLPKTSFFPTSNYSDTLFSLFPCYNFGWQDKRLIQAQINSVVPHLHPIGKYSNCSLIARECLITPITQIFMKNLSYMLFSVSLFHAPISHPA